LEQSIEKITNPFQNLMLFFYPVFICELKLATFLADKIEREF